MGYWLWQCRSEIQYKAHSGERAERRCLRMVMTIIEEMATEVKNPLDVLNQALDIELFEESETEEKTENSLIACDTEEQLHDVLDDDDIETESIEDDSEWI